MIEKIINGMIQKQIEAEQIAKEDINIYIYGYTLVYEVLINVIIAICIGILTHNLFEVTMFLALYIPLRSFCGGWHADKFWKCTVFSSLILIILVMFDDFGLSYCQNWIAIGIFFGCCMFILSSAAIETVTKPISYEENKIYKKKIRIIVICEVILFLMMLFFNCKILVSILEYVYIIQTCMLIIEIIHKKVSVKK